MTGWTWDYVHDKVTLPQVVVLSTYWKQQPPLVVLTSRLCRWAGIDVCTNPPATRAAATPDEAMKQCAEIGLAVGHGRPDDPMLDLIGL